MYCDNHHTVSLSVSVKRARVIFSELDFVIMNYLNDSKRLLQD